MHKKEHAHGILDATPITWVRPRGVLFFYKLQMLHTGRSTGSIRCSILPESVKIEQTHDRKGALFILKRYALGVFIVQEPKQSFERLAAPAPQLHGFISPTRLPIYR